jgi:hypothetical protein
MERPDKDVADLAALIAGSDDVTRPRVTNAAGGRGWSGLVARDRIARDRGHPNPVGGFATLLYPWRLYILASAIFLLPILVLISFLT